MFEIGPEKSEIPLDAAGAADQHMVGAFHAQAGKHFAGEGAEAALHPVSDDRAADLLRHGDSEAHGGIAVIAIADEQHETGHRGTAAAIGRQEIGAFDDRGEGRGLAEECLGDGDVLRLGFGRLEGGS